MRKLIVSPDQESYQLTVGPDTISVNYGGGASAFRRSKWSAPSIIQAGWTLSGSAYTYFMAFYRTSTAAGALGFLIDLVLGGGAVTECRARFVPGSVSLSGKQGDAFIVAAQLEVEVPLPDQAADLALIESFIPRY